MAVNRGTFALQTSQDLAEIAAAQDAKGFVARVREALPTVRESTDVGLSPPDSIRQSQRLESGALQRRSISLSKAFSYLFLGASLWLPFCFPMVS